MSTHDTNMQAHTSNSPDVNAGSNELEKIKSHLSQLSNKVSLEVAYKIKEAVEKYKK